METRLDTVWLFPHRERGVLVFRGVVEVSEADASDVALLLGAVERMSEPRPPELLAGGLREVKFRYRALDAQNRICDWEERWEQGDRMPLQVKIEVVDGRGDRWPPIVVSLPQAASFGGFSQVPV